MTPTQELGFRALIRELLGLPEHSVRPANQVAPVGDQSKPFITVLVTQENSIGIDPVSLSDGLGTLVDVKTEGHYPVTVSVQAFREGALNNMGRIRALMVHPLVHDRLMNLGLGYVSASAVRNLTGVLNRTLQEERAQLDLTFHTLRSEVLSVESIGVVPISVTLNDLTASREVIAP